MRRGKFVIIFSEIKNSNMNKVSVVVSKLLDLIGVQVTKTAVIEMLTNHPHYPSLLAVIDTSEGLPLFLLTHTSYQKITT